MAAMPRKMLIRVRRRLTAAERRRVDESYRIAEEDKESIIARGRRIMRESEAERAALRETFRLLKSERQSQGVTLQELEDRTGIGRGALSRLENDPNPNPTVRTLQRYAAALGKQIVVQLESANGR
jgi:DNA-binding XRE family transcriptional regulator